ncbi:DBH-like monooxygenase protein 2 homolog [Salminus brasiliensis]|uniref:DBH-like monooxygenase protein 2 homolog n=1 Tax=Salminus brasiliensis TaxID=930266 RepID=UPI003B830F26
MGVLFLLMYLILFMARVKGADVDPTLPFSDYLDPGSSILLRWGFDLVKDSIMFELSVKTTGWVGFGFSPNGGMAGADVVIGGVGPNGIYFTDRHAVANFLPLLDEQQDYKLLSLTEADGKTVMKFERSISACDEDDYSITEVPVKLIYAYGKTDNISYHASQRGTKEVNLLKFMPKARLPDSSYFDLTMTNFTVPAENTYYHCKVMNIPLLDQKYHIYRIEPLIENVDLVHHLLLYRCPQTVTSPTEEACYTGEAQTQCFQTVAAWGVGGGAFELPEVAGIPVGGDDGKILYRLEVHYNNQDKTPGRVDNSGLRFYYTSQLRQYDAAVLMTGLAVAPGYVIPPNATDFLSYGLCDTSHIPQVISDSKPDLQVFSVILHTHLAGRKVRVGHFRDGEQIDFLAMDEHYNFEFQQAVNLGRTKTVQLGDKLLVECTYDTENRTTPTLGGLSTANEMCLAFLFYYPAVSLSSCVSFPDPQALSREMGAANEVEWYKMMLLKHWDEKAIREYQQTLNRIQQYLIVGNIANNVSYHTGLIPELRAAPSVSCNDKNSSDITSPAVGLVLLLWLTASLALS